MASTIQPGPVPMAQPVHGLYSSSLEVRLRGELWLARIRIIIMCIIYTIEIVKIIFCHIVSCESVQWTTTTVPMPAVAVEG